jgi:hypothetical protein
MESKKYPATIHLPTAILPKIFVERITPVNAPNGESSNDRPRLASVNPSLYLIPGIEATQVPNKRLDDENKNPTANTGLSLMNDEMFLIIMSYELSAMSLKHW